MAVKKPTKKTKTPAAPKKTALRKPEASRKKRVPKRNKVKISMPMLVAFLAGIGMTIFCFFAVTGIMEKEVLPPLSFTEKQQKKAPPKKQEASPLTQALAKEEKNLSPDARSRHEIRRALADLQGLPYEEARSESFEERIQQVDYALLQAMWLRDLPTSSLSLIAEKPGTQGKEPYHIQHMGVLPGSSSAAYVRTLQKSLELWTAGASLHSLDKNVWSIKLDGIETHRVQLYPGELVFPDPVATPSQRPGKPPRLHRKPGEPALLVLVIDDLGESRQAVKRLLGLNYPVSFAFWPSGRVTREGAVLAGKAGREVLVHMPMEPMGYPSVKPGPGVLLAEMGNEEIARHLYDGIGKVPYAVALNNHMGSRFTQNREKMGVVLGILKEKKLFMLDSLTHPRSVFYEEAGRLSLFRHQRNVFLDDGGGSRTSVLQELKKAENIALLTGQSIAIGHPLPGTLDALEQWQKIRNKEVRIVRLQDLPSR